MTRRICRGWWGASIRPSRPNLAIVMDLVDGVLDCSSLPWWWVVANVVAHVAQVDGKTCLESGQICLDLVRNV